MKAKARNNEKKEQRREGGRREEKGTEEGRLEGERKNELETIVRGNK